MSKPLNKAMIGAFILGAFGLLAVGVIALGSGGLFKKSSRYVMYFSGSVKGLSVGAPVQLKGVSIGTVSEIHIVYNRSDETFLTEVLFNIPQNSVKITGHLLEQGTEKKQLTTATNVENMIDNGLRAKLQLQSFVTGQLLVDFDFYPNTPVDLKHFDNEWMELPTLPSDMDALAKTLDGLDLESIVSSVKNTITGMENLVNSPELGKSVGTLNKALEEYRGLAVNLDRYASTLSSDASKMMTDVRRLVNNADDNIDPVAIEIKGLLADLRKVFAELDRSLEPILDDTKETTTAAKGTLEQAERMFGNLAHLTDENSTFVYRVDETMMEIRKAASALAVLADYLNRHPEALLRGKRSNTVEGK